MHNGDVEIVSIKVTMLFILYLGALMASYPSNACGCVDESAIPTIAKILLFILYLIAFPIALAAIGAKGRQIGLYFIVFMLSCGLWFYHEFFVVLFPTLPFLFIIWYIRKNAHNKSFKQD